MKAAVFTGKNRIEMQDLPRARPGPDEVLIRVTACGVCGTDVHICRGDITKDIRPPVVLGHEIAGVIEEVGTDGQGLRTGQNVCVDPVVACGACRYCHVGRPNLCERPTIIGYVRHGGFAQFLVAPVTHVLPLGADTPPAAGILVETLACVLNGYRKLDLRPASTVLILGSGTVGLLWNQVLRRSPIARLIQAEPVAFRRERARALGADVVIDPSSEDLAARTREVAPEGIDCVIDASGDPQAVEAGIELVAKGGTFLVFGVCPAPAAVRVSPHTIYQKEMRIISSKMPPHALEPAARMILTGLIRHEMIVTDTFALARLPEAIAMFDAARDRQVKMVIDPWKD